jgi:cyanophycin synthetase
MDDVHPDNRLLVERAAVVLGLSVAGVDLLTPDIAQSYHEVGGVICEVNSSPGLRMFLMADRKRDVLGPILDMMFPNEASGRIPVAAIGGNGRTAAATMLTRILRHNHRKVGYAGADGAYVADNNVGIGDRAGYLGAFSVLRDPRTDCAVLEVSMRDLFLNGAGFDLCDVSAVTGIERGQSQDDDFQSVEPRKRLMTVITAATMGMVALNADDEHCLDLMTRSKARRICLISARKANEHVRAHIEAGGLAVTFGWEGSEYVSLHDGARSLNLMPENAILASPNDASPNAVISVLAAIALARGMGIPSEHIRSALTGKPIPVRSA